MDPTFLNCISISAEEILGSILLGLYNNSTVSEQVLFCQNEEK